MKKVVVVIPIHKSTPDKFEVISLRQCFKVLNKHSIAIVAPKGLDISYYTQFLPTQDIRFIDQTWLSSTLSYNKLKKSLFFYSLFDDFEYILTYEPDAFVFKDDLLAWCSKGYDYIGAPWFEGFTEATSEAALLGVGNSGFSLRKTATMISYLKRYVEKNPKCHSIRLRDKLIGILEYYFTHIIKHWGLNNSVYRYSDLPEDMFISFRLKKRYPKLINIAPIDEAKAFSFEYNPQRMFSMNNFQLPFGCHAWWRYDLEFWKPHINSFGYKVDLELCK